MLSFPLKLQLRQLHRNHKRIKITKSAPPFQVMPTTRRTSKATVVSAAGGAVAAGKRESPGLRRGVGEDVEDEDVSEDEVEIEPKAGVAQMATSSTFVLDGVTYTDYNQYVQAKRKRNHDKLQSLGLMNAATMDFMSSKKAKTAGGASQRGLRSNNKKNNTNVVVMNRRSSSRISGSKTSHVALDYNVKYWDRDMTTVVREDGTEDDPASQPPQEEAQRFFNDRINDGSDLTISDAVGMNDIKWIKDDSVELGTALVQSLVSSSNNVATGAVSSFPASSASHSTTSKETSKKATHRTTSSPTSVCMSASLNNRNDVDLNDDQTLASLVDSLAIDKEECVAKVTPDRIYSVAAHPGESKVVCCAGDKQGYVGLWDTSASNNSHHGVSLFRVHSRPICCLEWLSHDTMVTASYDGSIRRLHAERGVFEEIFATYDGDTTYLDDLGYDLDQGRGYWTQYVKADPRYTNSGNSASSSNPCFFVTTSVGDVFHLDLRVAGKEKMTFHESLSDKKVNTVSLHPNGTILASGGLDGVVRLFDLRKFRDNRGQARSKAPKPFCTQQTGLSISSSFFSPSGNHLLTTSFANRLDLIAQPHLKKGTVKPTYSIRHNNQTGRWLTTFQAAWHPIVDIFCCGSMSKPRCMEIFDASGKLLRAVTGESLASVMSRTCFHPTSKELIMIGGNSSGRMVVVRQDP